MTTMIRGYGIRKWLGTGAAAESSHLQTGSGEHIGNGTRLLKLQNLSSSVNKSTPSSSSHMEDKAFKYSPDHLEKPFMFSFYIFSLGF